MKLVSDVINFIISPFKREKEISLPYEYALISFTNIAREKGTLDDHNKIILIYRNEKIAEIIKYTPYELKVIKDVMNIPIYDLTKDEEEDYFEFDSISDLGVIR